MKIIHLFSRLALAVACAAMVFGGVAQSVQAAPLVKETVLTTNNGQVTFAACNGVCLIVDINPSDVGPVRPWQMKGPKINSSMMTFELTGKGIWTGMTDAKGNVVTYTGAPQVVCLAYSTADASAAGGRANLRVAYWDSSLLNCNDDWGVPCSEVKGNWFPLQTEYSSGMACARLRLTGSFALVKVTGP